MRRLLLIALLAMPVMAQKPAPIELGFKAGRVYEFGSVDHVNTFNGNLLVTIPLGPAYPVSSHLSYSLKLVYNSKIWDYRYLAATPNCDPFLTTCQTVFYKWSRPNRRSNASMGWRLSLGRLIAPDQWTSTNYPEEGGGLVYEGDSGDEHGLGFTGSSMALSDGSRMRMRVLSTTARVVEFPDGQAQTFVFERDQWRLRYVSDQFGNRVEVTYDYWSSSDDRVTDWYITDPHGRSHRVHFRYFSELADTIDQGMNIDYIRLDGATGPLYQFSYTPTPFTYFGPHHDVPPGFDGGPGNTPPSQSLLTSIVLPDSTSYSLAYTASDTNVLAEGVLSGITLPTLGTIAYAYQMYTLPSSDPCVQTGPRNTSPGISTRTADGNIWTYKHATETQADVVNIPPNQASPCEYDPYDPFRAMRTPQRWSRTSVLSPPDVLNQRSRTDYYFNIFAEHAAFCDERLHADLRDMEYGEAGVAGWPGGSAGLIAPPASLPVPAATSADAADEADQAESCDTYDTAADQRYLAQQIWTACNADGNCDTPLQSVYVRHQSVRGAGLVGRPVKSRRTVSLDDANCAGEPCHTQSDYSDHDGVGHWRTSVETSNFPDSGDITTTVQYTAYTDAELLAATTKWIFNRYSSVVRTSGAASRRATYCFSDTGLLKRERKVAGSTESVRDVVTEYLYQESTSGRVGDLVAEKSYGGDAQANLALSTDLCALGLGTPEYWTKFTHANGLLATVEPRTSLGAAVGACVGGADPCLKTADYTADYRGLVVSSKSTDGLSTQYAYKLWGALESVTPPGETSTVYTYSKATPTAFASIIAKRDPDPSITSDDVKTTFEYDRLGRVRRTERTIPGAGCVEQLITYDAQGRTNSESVWKPCGAASNATSFRYDAFGRPATVVGPDGKSVTTTYTGTRLITRTAEVGSALVATRQEYDALGRLVKVTQNADLNSADGVAGEETTTYSYDESDRLRGVSMPGQNGTQTRSFAYDGRGFLTSETQPELGANGNGTRTFSYDSRGHERSRTTGTYRLSMAYDSAERLTSVTDLAANRLLKLFAYDEYGGCLRPLCLGKLAAAVRYHYDADLGDPSVSEAYQYHATSGRLGRKDTAIGLNPGWSAPYIETLNTLGAVVQADYPCPTGNTGCIHVTNSYTNGILTSVDKFTTNPSSTTNYATLTYHPAGTVDTVKHGLNGGREVWTADLHGLPRPRAINAFNSANALTWSSGNYDYDGSGNVIRAGSMSYGYDAMGRLIGWTDTRPDGSFEQTGQGYDAWGNRLFNTYRGCGAPVAGLTTCYTTSVLAAEIKDTTNHYSELTYDSAGNVVTSGSRGYTYDATGAMTKLDDPQIRLRFLYDPQDERVAAVERVTGADGLTSNKITYTLRNFSNQLLSVWTVVPGSAAPARKEDAIWRGSMLLAREMATGTKHYSLDHLGSARAISDGNGNLLGLQQFAPFGAGGSSNGGAIQFTGHERDQASLANGAVLLPDYMHARYYDFDSGRFLSADPVLEVSKAMSNPQGWNRYAYVRNNPMRFVDLDGRADVTSEVASGVFGFLPFAGDIQDGITAVTGYDPITSEKQTLFTRVTSGVSAMIPFVGGKAVGKLILSAGAFIGLKSLSQANFAANLARVTGGVVDSAHAHHVLPQKFEGSFKAAGLDIHDPKYGAWWERTSHLKNASAYNKQWEQFLQQKRTQEEILKFGRQLADEYGIKANF